MKKYKLKKGDLVKILVGKHKGHESPIIKINKKNDRVSVEGLTQIKHVKPSQEDQEGGIRQIPATVHISNVALIDPKNKKSITKVGYEIKDGIKQRIARNSKAKLA